MMMKNPTKNVSLVRSSGNWIKSQESKQSIFFLLWKSLLKLSSYILRKSFIHSKFFLLPWNSFWTLSYSLFILFCLKIFISSNLIQHSRRNRKRRKMKNVFRAIFLYSSWFFSHSLSILSCVVGFRFMKFFLEKILKLYFFSFLSFFLKFIESYVLSLISKSLQKAADVFIFISLMSNFLFIQPKN
jgi:hypothetical protein